MVTKKTGKKRLSPGRAWIETKKAARKIKTPLARRSTRRPTLEEQLAAAVAFEQLAAARRGSLAS